MYLPMTPIEWNDWYMIRWRKFVVAMMLSVAACGTGEVTPTTTTVASSSTTPETTTTVAPDPYSLDDLPDAHTTLPAADTAIFDDDGYSGDLVASEFTCDALEQVASFEFVICAIGGTAERPFALLIGFLKEIQWLGFNVEQLRNKYKITPPPHLGTRAYFTHGTPKAIKPLCADSKKL
jgi:hypothetical protein